MSDIRLTLTADGTRIDFVGGQAPRDTGLTNIVLISLFTSPGWCGNALMKEPIGSDFEAARNQPITRRSLNEIREAAERALTSRAFGRVTVAVSNPTGHRLDVNIRLEPPGQSPQALRLSRDVGRWWIGQAAGERMIPETPPNWRETPGVYEGEDF